MKIIELTNKKKNEMNYNQKHKPEGFREKYER